MFTVGLVAFAFAGIGLCQQMQQLNTGLPSQYLPPTMSQGYFQGPLAAVQQAQNKFDDIENQSDKLLSSNLEVPQQQSQSYQDAVQQQYLDQSYPSDAFKNTESQYSINAPNSYHNNQDSQQYYVKAAQQAAEPQKESYSAALPAVIPATAPSQAQLEYKIQPVDTITQAQQEYKQQFAALEQARREYKQQFAALSQAQQELKQQFAAPVETQKQLKQQFAVLAQAQEEYKQQFSALSQAQKEYKQQYDVLNEAQQEIKKQFSAPTQTQLEYKQLFADLAKAQLESKQQFAELIQAQKQLKQQFVVPAQQTVSRQQYEVSNQGLPDYRKRFGGPAHRNQYIRKTATTAALAAAQPKSQYATIPQQYYTVSTGQVVVTEQPRVQLQSATNQSSSGVVVSTTTSPLRESVVYKSEPMPTLRQQRKVANRVLA
ncbi:hypothetical protein ACI65C_012477 [Semiaphis heraclei]